MPVVTPIPGSTPILSAQPAPSLAEIRPAMLSAVLDVGLNSTPSLGLQSPSIGWKRCRSGAVLEECRVGGSSWERHWPPGVLSHRSQERPVHAAEGASAHAEEGAPSAQVRPISSLPRALDALEEIRSRTRGKRVAVFLDYDGTLTPIVSNPEDAVLSESMRATVERLAGSKEVAIVSGRSREKVEAFVRLGSLTYAGSHGFDIAGPNGLRHTIAEAALPALAAARDALAARLALIPGAAVEDNGFSVSVHWRNVAEEHRGAVEAAARAEVQARPGLAMSRGKCVYEVRPELQEGRRVWHKGAAVRFLLDSLAGEAGEEVLPIYIGDDTTDEDAFAALAELGGLSFVVHAAAEAHERPRETLGSHVLADVGEVEALLSALASF